MGAIQSLYVNYSFHGTAIMTPIRTQFYSERIYARASRPVEARLRKAAAESRTWTAREIVAEILRDSGHSAHIGSKAKSPVSIYGYAPQRLHDYVDALETLASRQTESYVRRGKQHERVMKSTTPILLAAVASYPEPNMEDTPERRQWIGLVIEAAKARWGKRLRSVIAHVDETFFHVHILADNAGRPVKGMHMGHAAAAAEPVTSRKGEAYRLGCTAVQDWYSKHIAGPLGWARMSPTPRYRVGRAEALRRRQAELENLEVDLMARAQRVVMAEADLRARAAKVNASWALLGQSADRLTVLRDAIENQGAIEARLRAAQDDDSNPLL
jgi:hypothetical protein